MGEYASILKTTILDLLEVLSARMLNRSDEKEDLAVVSIFFNRAHELMIMDKVIEHVLPRKSQIEMRDQKFFEKNKFIFAGLPDNRVSHYESILNDSSRITKEDKDEIWQYVDTILTCAEEYKKNE